MARMGGACKPQNLFSLWCRRPPVCVAMPGRANAISRACVTSRYCDIPPPLAWRRCVLPSHVLSLKTTQKPLGLVLTLWSQRRETRDFALHCYKESRSGIGQSTKFNLDVSITCWIERSGWDV